MIRVDENDPIGELEPSFPYRDVQIKWNVDVKQFYELQSEIGRGKFGTVYKCKEKATGLALAAKFVAIARRQERKNVEREVEIMRELQHPRLIQIYDAFESSNVMCVVLELIEGGELFERVIDDDFILTEKACTVFVRQICEAVEFIHSKNILHLDMKPENILCLTKTGNRIKIIDFGLARKFDPGKKLQVLFGTPEFVAPEVVNFDQIGFGTDMWSVGVICYVLLSGLSPFMGETDVATMANVTIAMYDFDDDAFSTISEDAKDFIRKLLVKDKEQRMTAMQSLQHSWLRRKPPLQKPTVKRLDSTKDNLRSCVDRWGDQTSPTPFIIQSPIVKEIETDEPKLPELLRPSVVIPTNVQMKENTLSPTSPQSPLAKKIKLQETSDETAKTKSSKKSDSKSKSGSVQKSKSSSSSSNSDIEPSDSGSTVNNSINAQALKTSPAGKGQQLNGTSKVTSQNEMPSRNSVSLQVLKSSSVVKGQPLNSTSKESADRKTPISNDISPQVLELTSAGKEQQLNTSNVMTENKATAGISSSPQVIKNNRTGKEQQINGTCKSTTENKASWSNSVNPEVLNTSPVGNGKLLNGNFKVKTESKELSYFGDSLNNSIQCLGQLGKYIAPQLTFNGSQILRQENMDSGTNIATNFRDNINTKLGESKSNEKSKGGQSDETQGIKISCQTAVSDSQVKEDKPITTNHTDQIMSSINACLVEPVVHESELVNSMKLNNDDLMSRAQSNLPDNVQNTKAQSTLGPQNGPANKNNGHSENSKDLQPKKMQPITVTYSETKTSSNSPSPQTTVTSPLVPSRDSIIPITVGDWSQSKTLGNNLKEESASAKTVERSKKPAKQLGNNISCLKSIWGSKISANEAKHHPIVKYNRTLSSPASTTAKSRFQGPKPQKLHESEEDSSQIAGSTNCPKVILHRIDVEDADTKNQISSLSTSYNQSSTESRLNVNSAMKNSNNVSNNNKNSSKKPINEWVNEKLLNDRFNIDRRASDISSLVNSDSFYEDNVDCVGSRLAEEISRITDKFCRINDDDDSRGRSNDKSAIIAQERHEKITDLLNGKRRPKYRRLTYLSRDVPVGSPPPPTSLTYYLTNCLTSNSTSPMWPGTGCNFFSAPGTPVGSPRSPSEGSLDTDLIFQMLSQKLKADANLQNNTPPKKTGLINT